MLLVCDAGGAGPLASAADHALLPLPTAECARRRLVLGAQTYEERHHPITLGTPRRKPHQLRRRR